MEIYLSIKVLFHFPQTLSISRQAFTDRGKSDKNSIHRDVKSDVRFPWLALFRTRPLGSEEEGGWGCSTRRHSPGIVPGLKYYSYLRICVLSISLYEGFYSPTCESTSHVHVFTYINAAVKCIDARISVKICGGCLFTT